MPTALTYDQVIAQLASTGQRTITGSVMQNVVESFVHPVVGGGFDSNYAELGGFHGTPSNPGSFTIVGTPTVPRNPMVYATPNANEDPLGWWTNVPYVSPWWFLTFPQSFLLTPGIYLWNLYADFGAAGYHVNTDTSTLDAFFTRLDDPSDQDWVHGGRIFNEPVYIESLYKPGNGSSGDNGEGHLAQGLVRVPRVDNLGAAVTTQRFGVIYRLKGQTDIVTGFRSLTILKIA